MPNPRRTGRPADKRFVGIAKTTFLDALVAAGAAGRDGLQFPTPRRDRVVEDAFFRAAAALETFVSDWFLRCLSLDASVFRATYEKKAANWAKAELASKWEPSDRLWKDDKREIGLHVEIPIPKRHSLAGAAALLNANDDNVGFRGAQDLAEKALAWLVEPYASRPPHLGTEQASVIDATVAIRNVLAHGSGRSVKTMNERLKSGGMPEELSRTANDVRASGIGHYLQARAGDRRRFEIFFELLALAAHGLARTKGHQRRIFS